MSEPKKNNPLLLIGALVFAAAVLFLLFRPGQQIEDVNGSDDCSLATLTEADILADKRSFTGLSKSTGRISLPGGWEINDGVKLSSDAFSGVADLLWADYILPSDFYLELSRFQVEGGNFRMVVVNNDEIIAEIQPGEDQIIRIDDITGPTSLRIAGESAAFTIVIPSIDYDSFEHD